MKFLKHISSFKDKLLKKEYTIYDLLKKYNITDYTLNDDGTIDSDQHINLSNFDLVKLPFNFNKCNFGFLCNLNKLKSLAGSPQYVNNIFDCSCNQIKTLKSGPIYVRESYYCYKNDIWTFEGFPEHLGGVFMCDGNPIHEIWLLFEDKSKVELLNDYDIFRDDGKSVVLDRLNSFLEDIGKPPVTSLKLYKCI